MVKSEFTKMKERALAEPTLEEALALLAIWEMERIVAYTKHNDGPYESCFRFIFKIVLEEYGHTTDTT